MTAINGEQGFVLTGWACGGAHWGGYSQKAGSRRLAGAPTRVAGYAARMAVGQRAFRRCCRSWRGGSRARIIRNGPSLVKVRRRCSGSVAVRVLAILGGMRVADVNRAPDTADYLEISRAFQPIVAREELEETSRPRSRPRWAGCMMRWARIAGAGMGR